MRLALIPLLLALSGCASFTQPENGIRTTEYTGHLGGIALPVRGKADVKGCMTVTWGSLPEGLSYLYESDTCIVRLGTAE